MWRSLVWQNGTQATSAHNDVTNPKLFRFILAGNIQEGQKAS
jgi:hypothetical protein